MKPNTLNWLRRGMIWLITLITLLVMVVVAILELGRSKPGRTFEVAGTDATITIRFDERLRPWVQAESLSDVLLAEGWLHARYRLWQMELLRRAGNGRLAEGLGAGLLDSDKALWRAGVPQLAERLTAGASAETLAFVDAYVAGINNAIEHLAARPPEFWLAGLEVDPWTRRDVFAVGAVIAFQSANNSINERLRLALRQTLDPARFAAFLPAESRAPDFPYILREGAGKVDLAGLDALDSLSQALFPSAALGSSGWVVAPQRSKTGHALFAFDSHDDLSLPNLFYEVHLFYGPGRSIRGWSLAGLPGVINGFNEHLAWGLTNIGDTQDLFLETRDAQQPDRFLMDGQWLTARAESVEIPVKGRAEPERLTVLHTRNGPLVSDEPPLALRWTGHDLQGGGLDSLLAMNTASDLSEFEAALDRHLAPASNVTYADREGNILFRTIGLLPIRGAGKGLLPQPGDRSSNGWTGYVPASEMPRALNPPAAYLAAANARVHGALPLVSADNAAGYRMGRLHDVLSSRRDFLLDDMQALQVDFYNTQARWLLPSLLPALDAVTDDVEREASDILQSWAAQPLNTSDSAGALLWEHWYVELARSVFGAGLDDDLLRRLMRRNYVLNHALDRLIRFERDSAWWQGRRDGIVLEAFSAAVREVRLKAGSDPRQWRWDRAQSVHFRHELDGAAPLLGRWLSRGPLPWAGGPATLGRARYRYAEPFTARAGATVRVVAEMTPAAAGAMEVRAIIPGGQHGHPWSNQYDDQLDAWLAGNLDELAPPADDPEGLVTRLVSPGYPER